MSRVRRKRDRATRFQTAVIPTATGKIHSETRASCQSSTSMATSVPISASTLADMALSPTATRFSSCPTSLVRREISAPVLARS